MNPNQACLTALTTVAFMLAAPAKPAAGDVITSMTTSAPTIRVETSSTAFNNSLLWKNRPDQTPPRRDVGQTFTVVTGYTLDKITVHVSAVGSGALGAPFVLLLERYTNAVDTTPDSLVVSEAGVLPGTIPTGQFLVLDLTDIELTPGQYGFRLNFPTAGGARQMNLSVQQPGTFASGRAITTTDGVTYETNAPDLVFYVQSIPEPSSMGLLLPIIGLLLHRR